MNKQNKLKVINRDVLKYIAVTAMFIGHFLLFTIKEYHFFGIPKQIVTILVNLQYIAPPIFFFCIAEGFRYTNSKAKYALRLFVFAVITQIAYVLCHTLTFDVLMFFTDWNVIMTFFLGLVILIIWECKLPLPARLLMIAACGALNLLISLEWGITGLLIIFAFYLLREHPYMRLLAYELIFIGYITISSGRITAIFTSRQFQALFLSITLSGLLITFFYNGKKGKHPIFSKYFFYIFYPAHLLLIFFVRLIAS